MQQTSEELIDQPRVKFEKETPMIRAVTLGATLSLAIVIGSAMAQAQSLTVNAPTSATTKQAVSKACSDQANAKGLHGKERKKFRSECKKRGGK